MSMMRMRMRMRGPLLTCCLVLAVLAQNIVQDEFGNTVIGENNQWAGEKNTIQGASNQVIGDSNQVTGANNVIQGSNNVVGDISSEELAALQKQMADRLSSRFGNIFSRFDNSPFKSTPQAQPQDTKVETVQKIKPAEKV